MIIEGQCSAKFNFESFSLCQRRTTERDHYFASSFIRPFNLEAIISCLKWLDS